MLGAVILVLLGLSTPGWAQEVIDQQNDPETAIGFACGAPPFGNGTLLQSFIPAAGPLSAVELRLRTGENFPSGGLNATVRIRAGDPDGTILAETTGMAPGPQVPRTQLLVRFEFDGVELVPGDTYFIEWVAPGSDIATWMGRNDDPYPGGTTYACFGSVWPGGMTDLNFTTFTEPVATSPKDLLKALAEKTGRLVSGRKGVCLHVLLRSACRSVERDRPGLALLKLRIFQRKVRLLAMFGWLDRGTAKELVEDAGEIVELLRQSRPKSRRKCRRRHR